MPFANEKPTAIYWLFDTRPEIVSNGWPDGKPFYCGKTIKKPIDRLSYHKGDALRRPNREHSKRILECGSHIAIRVIEIVPPHDDWITRERHWIAHLRSYVADATNIADGGEGAYSGGRPPLGVKRVQFMLPPKLIDEVRKIQKNVSDFIRKAIEEKLLEDEKSTLSSTS